MATLALQGIGKSFGEVEVLRGIDLAVGDGEFVVLVGPSGCGKSTLLRVIAGLERQDTGELRLDGTEITTVAAAERGLAMVFQSYALYPHMTVAQNMAFALENARQPRARIDARVGEVAKMLRLDGLLKRKPAQLSGGQRQRVAIGRAMVRDPKAFLFDEPLSNLDAELRVAMRKELAALHATIATTMIYVTHDQVEAMTLADRIVVMNGGAVEQAGTPLDVYNSPANMFVAGFIGSPRMNFLPAKAVAGQVTLDGGVATGVPAPAGVADGAALTVGVRPEHLEVGDGNGTAELACRVDINEQLGGESYLYCTAADGNQLTVHRPGQNALARGDTVNLRLPPAQLHLFDAGGFALDRPGNV